MQAQVPILPPNVLVGAKAPQVLHLLQTNFEVIRPSHTSGFRWHLRLAVVNRYTRPWGGLQVGLPLVPLRIAAIVGTQREDPRVLWRGSESMREWVATSSTCRQSSLVAPGIVGAQPNEDNQSRCNRRRVCIDLPKHHGCRTDFSDLEGWSRSRPCWRLRLRI